MLLDANTATVDPPAPKLGHKPRPDAAAKSRDEPKPSGDRCSDSAPQPAQQNDDTSHAPKDATAAKTCSGTGTGDKTGAACPDAGSDDSQGDQANADVNVIAAVTPVVTAVGVANVPAPISDDKAPAQSEKPACNFTAVLPTTPVTTATIIAPNAESPQPDPTVRKTAPNAQCASVNDEPSSDQLAVVPSAGPTPTAATKIRIIPANPDKSAKFTADPIADAAAGETDDAPAAAQGQPADVTDKPAPPKNIAQADRVELAVPLEQGDLAKIATTSESAPVPTPQPTKATNFPAVDHDAKISTQTEPPQSAVRPAKIATSNANTVRADTTVTPHQNVATTNNGKSEHQPESEHPKHLTSEQLPATDIGATPPIRANIATNAITSGADALQAAGAQFMSNQAVPAPILPASALPSAVANAIPLAGLPVEIASQAKDGKNRFEIRLDPPELGRIDVRLDIDSKGNVTSRLTVERQETLDLLRRDAPQIERALQSAGLKTSDQGLQFSLRDQSFSGRSDNAVARLVLPEDESIPLEVLRQGYGRLSGLGGGIDIRV